GLSVGADIIPVGGKAKSIEKGVEQLVKATTEKEVRTIMKGTPQEIIDRVAPAIAQTKDPNIVKNIIERAANPKPLETAAPVNTAVAPPTVPKDIPKPDAKLGEQTLKELANLSHTPEEFSQ